MATSLFVAESLPIIRPDRVFIYSGRDNMKWYLWFIVSGTESKMQGEGSLDLLGAAYQKELLSKSYNILTLKLSMFGKANWCCLAIYSDVFFYD